MNLKYKYAIMIIGDLKMNIRIGVSARHIHLCESDFKKLFGSDKALTKHVDLTQPGQYACNEKVNLITEKGKIENVRILGPLRDYTQVEISKTDSYSLGLNPPVRKSGDLKGAENIKIEYLGNIIEVKECCIIADRHIHITYDDLDKYNLKDNQIVKLKISSEKGAILENVKVKASKEAFFEAHIDLDDANANLVKNGDYGEIIYE